MFVTNTSRLSVCAPNSRASWTHCITHRKQRSGVSLDTQDCRLLRSLQVAHSAESSMLKRRGLLGTRSPRTHNEAAFCALNAHTEADHRLQRSHQAAHSPSPQCSNAEVYSVRDRRTRTMRQLSGTQCAHRSGPRLLRSRRVATSRDLNAQTQRSTRYAITAHAQ